MILAALANDVRFFHALLFPRRQPTVFSWIRVACSSRGLLVLAIHRMTYGYLQWRPVKHFQRLLKLAVSVIAFVGGYLSAVLAKNSIRNDLVLEPGVYLSNSGHIVLGARFIGTGTVIHDRVTIGMDLFDRAVPEIGRNVWIGPCSVIYGNIKVADGATILPNTVLTKSVPAGAVVQGNPARVIRRGFDNGLLRRTLNTDIEYLFAQAELRENP
jgi:serine acetyltransferase